MINIDQGEGGKGNRRHKKTDADKRMVVVFVCHIKTFR